MKNVIFILFYAISAVGSFSYAALSDSDKQYIKFEEILKNPGFENGSSGWTITNSTPHIDTSKFRFGKQALKLSLSSQSGDLLKQTATISQALGQTFEGSFYISTTMSTIQVCSIVASIETTCVNVPASSSYIAVAVPIYGTANNQVNGVKIKATASSTGDIYIDGGHLGSPDLLNKATPNPAANSTGTIFYTAASTCPVNSIAADGSAISRSTYAAMFNVFGTTFGAGDGSTTFNLPDMRGIFVRGSGSQTIGSSTYSGTLGTKQNDQFKSHNHISGLPTSAASPFYYPYGADQTMTGGRYDWANSSTGTQNMSITSSTGGSETRPANIAMTACIWNTSSSYTVATPNQTIDMAGTIISTATSCPAGTLPADGSAVSRATYYRLFSKIGITHGQGDGSTTFNVPDYRGRFLRGVDGGSGRDPDAASRTAMNTGGNTGNAVGSVQEDEFKRHNHHVPNAVYPVSGGPIFNNNGQGATGVDTDYAGGNETRPKNAYVNYCIVYDQALPQPIFVGSVSNESEKTRTIHRWASGTCSTSGSSITKGSDNSAWISSITTQSGSTCTVNFTGFVNAPGCHMQVYNLGSNLVVGDVIGVPTTSGTSIGAAIMTSGSNIVTNSSSFNFTLFCDEER